MSAPLQPQLVDVPFGGGLSQHVQDLLVNPPQLLEVLNGVFTKSGVMKKRFGATAATLTGVPNVLAPNAVFDHEGELCQHTSFSVIALSQENQTWRNTHLAGVRPCEITSRPRVRSNLSVRNLDSAVIGDLVCTVWESNAAVWCEVREQDTGAVLIAPRAVHSALKTFPRVVAVGGRYFLIAGKDGNTTTAGVLDQCRTKVCSIDTNTRPLAISAPTTAGTQDASSYDFVCPPFATSAHLCEADGNTIRVSELKGSPGAAPTLANTSDLASAHGSQDYATAIYFSDVLGRVFIASVPDAANVKVHYSDWTGGGGYGAWTTVSHAHTLPSGARKLTLVDRDDSHGMWLAMHGTRGSGNEVHKTEAISLTTSAALVAGSKVELPNFALATKAFRPSGYGPLIGLVYDFRETEYIGGGGRSLQQTGIIFTTYALVEGQSTTHKFAAMARFHQDVAAGPHSGAGVGAGTPGEDAYFQRHLCSVPSYPGGYMFARATIAERNHFGDIQKQAGDEVRFTVSPKPLRARGFANGTVFSGGYFGAYDGVQSHESALHMYPEEPSRESYVTAVGIGGKVRYKVVFEWTDHRGLLHRSRPSPESAEFNFHAAGGDNNASSVTLRTTFVPPSARDGSYGSRVIAVLYRREVDVADGAPGGTTVDAKYREVSRTLVPAISDVCYLYLTDTGIASHSVAYTTAPVLYTEGGELPSEPPPAFLDIAATKRRVFGISGEDSSTAWYSKLLDEENLIAPEWNGNLKMHFPSDGGGLVAIEAMDDKVVFFKRDRVYYVTGDGPDNKGADDTFSPPQPISSDTGCVNRSSVVAGPWGIVFESARGIYLLDRGLQLHYIGGPVEDALAGQTINAAVLVAERSEVRFTLGNATALVWNYLYQQWSTFNGFTSVHACTWGGVYARVLSTYQVRYEDEGTYIDEGGFAPALQITTAWIKIGALQGFVRLWKVLMLTKHHGDGFNVSVGYDYEPDFTTSRGWTAVEIAALTVPQLAYHIPRQQIESVRFQFRDIGPGGDNPNPSTAGYTIVGLTLEVGSKKGAYRLPAAAKK